MRWSRDRIHQWRLSSSLGVWVEVIIALVGYGVVRVGVTAASVFRDGWPESALGWSGAVSSVAAASQAIAVAVLLPAARRRRPVLATTIAAVGIGIALVDAAMWVVLGGAAAPAGYAWQFVIAVVLAVAAMVLCRSGIGSIWSPSGYRLPRITRMMFEVGGVAAFLAAAAGAAALAVDQPAAVDRLLRLIAVAGLAGAVSAAVVAVVVASERWRVTRRARVDELYRGIGEGSDIADR